METNFSNNSFMQNSTAYVPYKINELYSEICKMYNQLLQNQIQIMNDNKLIVEQNKIIIQKLSDSNMDKENL